MPFGWTLVTPPRPAALAVVQIAGDARAVAGLLGIPEQPVGSIRLRDLMGVDSGLVAVVTDRVMQLTPHGGPEVVRALLAELSVRGIAEVPSPDAATLYPEAASALEAEMMRAMARAASPEALGLLALQPSLWAASGMADPAGGLPACRKTERDLVLCRLIDPPLVVALGPANIGKSTLLNRLARREVAIVADEPGTTRDHVGAWVNLAGLVVNYLDTPGIRDTDDEIEANASRLAREECATADLVLLMGDAQSPPPPLPPPVPTPSRPEGIATDGQRPPSRTLRVHLRRDLGVGSWPHDVSVSSESGEGLADLAAAVRRALLPIEDRTSEPWVFW